MCTIYLSYLFTPQSTGPKLREAILRQDAQGKYFYDTTQFQFYRAPITTHANTFAQLTHDSKTPTPSAGTPHAVQIDHTTPLQYQTLMFCPPNQFFSVQQVGYSPQHRNAVLEGRSGPYDVTSASNPHHVDELDLYNALFIGDYVQDGSVVNICTPYDITFLLLPFFLRHFSYNKTHLPHLNPYNHAQLDGGAAIGFAPFADIIALSTMTQRLAALSRSPDEDIMPHNNSPADDVVFFWERLCYNLPNLHHILSKWCDIQHVGAGSIFSRPDDFGVPSGGDDIDEEGREYKQQQEEANGKDYFQQQQPFPNDPHNINEEMNLGDESDPFQQTMSQQATAQQTKTTSTKKQDVQMTAQQLVTIDNQRYAYKLNYGKLFTFLSQKFWRIAYQCTQITTLIPAGLSNNPKPQSGNTMNNIPNLLPPPAQSNNATTSQKQQPGAFQPILVSVTSDVLSLYDFNGMYQPWDSASDYIFANALCLLGNELPPSYFTTLFLPSFTSNNNKPFTTTRIGHVMYRIPDPSDSSTTTTTTTTTTTSKGGYTEFNKKGEEITVVRDSEFIPDAQTFGTKRPNPTATATPAKDNKKAKAAPEKKPLPAGQKTLSAFFGKK